MKHDLKLAVVIPCYKVRDSVGEVIQGVRSQVQAIYVVDDACPQDSGDHVEARGDPIVQVLRNERNLGVGGAMLRGYRQALQDGADIVIKMDGDGQMDPDLLPRLLRPIVAGQADYAKGNRFGAPRRTADASGRPMPPARLFGNSVLSFGHKAVSGYWNIMDPTNGYTAIGRAALEHLDLDALAHGYFFETDMLFQLNMIGAVVKDVPLPARYGDEQSSLRIGRVLREFPFLLLNRFVRRIFFKYFLFDFNVASLELLCGLPLFSGGVLYGLYRWIIGISHNQVNTAGTVMLGALPIILGFQLLLSAISYDINNVPKTPLGKDLE